MGDIWVWAKVHSTRVVFRTFPTFADFSDFPQTMDLYSTW